MAITLIRTRPETPQSNAGVAPLIAEWRRRAERAGQSFALRQCRDAREAARAVLDMQSRRENPPGRNLLIIDADADAELQAAVDQLDEPYVELHRDEPTAPHPAMRKGRRRLGLVQGYGDRGLDLALWIAFESLGCEAVNDDYHVGT